MQNLNFIEKILFKTIVLTWVFYLFGALYVVGPVLGWSVAGIAFGSFYLGDKAIKASKMYNDIPIGVWIWTISMLGMLVVLWIGHTTNGLGVPATIKSTIGWAKGWALFPIFIFIGTTFKINREVIIRAYCVLGLTTLILSPIFLAAPFIGLPEKLYVSPLKVVGGPGPEFFAVYLYTLDPTAGARWQFFTPWSPFAGLIGVLSVLICAEDRNLFFKTAGIAAGTMMVFLTFSRMSLIGIVVCAGVGYGARLLTNKVAWSSAALLTSICTLVAGSLFNGVLTAIDKFHGARASSTRVRSTLQRIARERWANEAPFFGHGSVEPGSHLVEYMPIGSHHTWFGLLFVKGIVGVFMLAIPMLWTIFEAFIYTVASPRGRLSLGIMLAILFFSFGENMEMQVYMFWPALVLVGITMREIQEMRAPEEQISEQSEGRLLESA